MRIATKRRDAPHSLHVAEELEAAGYIRFICRIVSATEQPDSDA